MAKLSKQIRRRLPLVGIFIVLLIGIGIFMYPIVSNWYGEYTAHTEISAYDTAIQTIGDDAIRRLENAAVDYNKALADHDTQKISAISYKELLAVSESIGYIEIPKINVYLPIYHGLSDEVLQRGIGHMEGSSLPVGGGSTHCVLAGHTGLPSANLFTNLDQVRVGDYIYIHSLDKVLVYKVDQIVTVLPYETEYTQIVDGEDYVTLVTCTPYGINSHRLLVRGSRVPYKTETMQETSETEWPVIHKEEDQRVPVRTIVWYAGLFVVSAVVLIILIILLFPSFRKKKPEKKAEKNNDDSGQVKDPTEQ